MTLRRIPGLHPGEVLMQEFLLPLGLSQTRLATDIGVPPRRINEIVLAKRAITADTALRLGRYFKMSPQFWLGLQMDYAYSGESGLDLPQFSGHGIMRQRRCWRLPGFQTVQVTDSQDGSVAVGGCRTPR